MKLIDGDNLIEHAEANGESFEFIRKLIDYISDEPEIKASISQGHEDDLISRKAAMDAIGKYLKKDGDQIVIADVVDAAVAIAQLPSEHPELDEWCDTCKEYDHERHCCPRWNRVIKTTLEEAQPDLQPTCNQLATDCISRQAAITEIHKSVFEFFDICDGDEESPMTLKDKQLLEINKAISTRIKNLPSALPEVRTEMSSPKNSERTAESSQNVQDDDLISRKAAMDALEWKWAGKAAIDAIKNLPSAQPELTENWWKTDHGYMWLCPHCGLPVHSDFEECLRCGIKRPSAQPEWNNHTVACLLAELFDDTCACNYNDIDEWLPEKCELFDSCPHPSGVACWEQFLKHKEVKKNE